MAIHESTIAPINIIIEDTKTSLSSPFICSADIIKKSVTTAIQHTDSSAFPFKSTDIITISVKNIAVGISNAIKNNKIFDIKAEKIEFAKIIKYVCGNLLKIEVDVSLTEKQLKIAEGLILAYKNNKKITKDDFISLTLENDTMFNGKTADEIIKYA